MYFDFDYKPSVFKFFLVIVNPFFKRKSYPHPSLGEFNYIKAHWNGKWDAIHACVDFVVYSVHRRIREEGSLSTRVL